MKIHISNGPSGESPGAVIMLEKDCGEMIEISSVIAAAVVGLSGGNLPQATLHLVPGMTMLDLSVITSQVKFVDGEPVGALCSTLGDTVELAG